jgi:DAK2 domain fusion protein YloV
MSPEAFDAHSYMQVIRRFVAHLSEHESLLNDLNVFPVPDGDTGTNSLLTVSRCVDVSLSKESSLTEVAQDVAKVASNQARGNSGVILSEYLRGLSNALVEGGSATQWKTAFSSASAVARASVSHPKNGTILTVADQVASVGSSGIDLAEYFLQVSMCARLAVQATTEQMPELMDAGVVDAGALALSLFYDALAAEASGQEMPALELDVRTCALDQVQYTGPSHEVMFRFNGSATAVAALRASLDGIGDSVTVSGQHPPYLVHVHVDDPDEAVRAGMLLGRVQRITVTQLLESGSTPKAQLAAPTDGAGELGLVVVCHGAAMAEVLQGLGVQPVVALPRSEPATWEIRDAIVRTGAHRVVIMPSDPDCLGSSQLAARDVVEYGIEAQVIPTASIVQSLAACSVFDAQDTLTDAVAALSSVASHVRHGAVTLADRAAQTPAGPCQQGDVLGLIDGRVHFVSGDGDIVGMLRTVVAELVFESAERITVVEGHGDHTEYMSTLAQHHPTLEIDVVAGGQMLWPYIVGVE